MTRLLVQPLSERRQTARTQLSLKGLSESCTQGFRSGWIKVDHSRLPISGEFPRLQDPNHLGLSTIGVVTAVNDRALTHNYSRSHELHTYGGYTCNLMHAAVEVLTNLIGNFDNIGQDQTSTASYRLSSLTRLLLAIISQLRSYLCR